MRVRISHPRMSISALELASGEENPPQGPMVPLVRSVTPVFAPRPGLRTTTLASHHDPGFCLSVRPCPVQPVPSREAAAICNLSDIRIVVLSG